MAVPAVPVVGAPTTKWLIPASETVMVAEPVFDEASVAVKVLEPAW